MKRRVPLWDGKPNVRQKAVFATTTEKFKRESCPCFIHSACNCHWQSDLSMIFASKFLIFLIFQQMYLENIINSSKFWHWILAVLFNLWLRIYKIFDCSFYNPRASWGYLRVIPCIAVYNVDKIEFFNFCRFLPSKNYCIVIHSMNSRTKPKSIIIISNRSQFIHKTEATTIPFDLLVYFDYGIYR